MEGVWRGYGGHFCWPGIKHTALKRDQDPPTVIRYSTKDLASLRKKRGLFAADLGKLLCVSGALIYV